MYCGIVEVLQIPSLIMHVKLLWNEGCVIIMMLYDVPGMRAIPTYGCT